MSLKKIIKNIKYLRKINLKEQLSQGVVSTQIDDMIDNLKYELYDEIQNLKVPNIKSIEETIDTILSSNASICRFGDGELDLIYKKSIHFQIASDKIQERLIEVLSSNHKNTLIAIPRVCYTSKSNLTDSNKHFWRAFGGKFRKLMDKYINFDHQYYAAEVTLASSYFKDYDYTAYFNKMQTIWNKKDIVIICGKTIFDKLDYNIFDNAQTIEYQYAPSINAFEEYNHILNTALKIDQKKLILIILGPTATILAYDLSQKGYQALDFGHISKSYDWFLKQKCIDASDFFDPD